VTSLGGQSEFNKAVGRLAATGLAAALLVGLAGAAVERARFGATDEASVARVEAELRQQFDDSASMLRAIATRVAASPDLIRAAPRDAAAAQRLFDALYLALDDPRAGRTGVTVYGTGATPVAWAGRVSDLPDERIQGPAALFVAPGALGPRLVRVEPLTAREGLTQAERRTIVVEQLLGQARVAPGYSDTFVLPASIVPVSLRARLAGTGTGAPYSFLIPSSEGQLLVEARIAPADLAAARARWRSGARAAVLSVLAVTVLLLAGPLLDLRRRAPTPRVLIAATVALLASLVAGRVILLFAAAPLADLGTATMPIGLLLWALLLVAVVGLLLDLLERRRVARPRSPLLELKPRPVLLAASAYFAAGAVGASLVWAYQGFLQNVVSRMSFDLLHFSLHPLSATRLAIGFGLVLLHAGVIWTAALVIRLAAVSWRRPRFRPLRLASVLSWMLGVAFVLALRTAGTPGVTPLLVAVAAAGGASLLLARPRARARRASQAARLAALYAALILPGVAMYPSLHAFATDAKERLVAAEYGPQAARLRDDLQDSLSLARGEIDALPSLSAFIDDPADGTTSSDAAYQLWSQTDLAALRLTSAVELYGPDGGLVSRFALNLPEYAPSNYRAAGCGWDIIEEVSPFGSSERHVLRASRGICDGRRQLGAIAVRVMLDYRTLPFISSQSPYLQSLGAPRDAPEEGAPGRDVEFAVYGWSRAPLYVSGTSAWPLPDRVFERMVDSRARFWEALTRDGEAFRVYFLNDRGGIYALGYPTTTGFGHLVNLAELITLGFALYVLLLCGATFFNALTSRVPASGRALLREVRSSFYRKLFLAFVAVALVPVFILAFATRTYYKNRLETGVEASAVQTATVAQRLVEDYATLQQQGTGALRSLDDQIMVVVGRAIDQAVNLFDQARLQATSERDLFASGLLPTRTPADVYRKIVLERLPTFVGEEEVGGLRYLVAAAPVRAWGREGIVTVPQTLRQQEIEEQIDELDRRVLFASVLFVLLGAGLGYWMAERIADPVNRLTRATRRIARGDLDARIAATSSDELGRLVEDFNHMAADLKRQRAELERSQRLEAWAEMARQVAHDIKNPLTPIQLSAEHARRVNDDRGRPLSPVLDDCITAILTQVKLLRQLSSEFSSFASSPTARPEPTDVAKLIDEVIEPYRAGLSGRIAVDVEARPDLPTLPIDRTLFARALTNVIENALHAMPGSGRLTIRTDVTPSAGAAPTVTVEIADTGVGMDQEAVERIFEPYFSTKATGTGLGLTIAKRNVELHGGTIAVTSARGGGTTATITLPVTPPS